MGGARAPCGGSPTTTDFDNVAVMDIVEGAHTRVKLEDFKGVR